MSERTSSAETLDRAAAADTLNDIASALREGEEMRVRVGNKEIELTPPETVNYRIEVTEKRTRFRGNRETVTIELDWKPE
jgi:amphi-Trp domain-containing protein